MQNKWILLLLLLLSLLAKAQDDKPQPVVFDRPLVVTDTLVGPYDANRPARAAFYSAILPGLGQAYNKKYWKVPIVYAGLGIGVAIYLENRDQYNELRDAFRIRLAGGTDDQFSRADGTPIISREGLERAQQRSRRNMELSLLITGAMYVLQVIDANVNGHLDQFDVSRDLTFRPFIMEPNSLLVAPSYGMSIAYTF